MTDRALLLTPSRGLGGGIERYMRTLEGAFAAQDVRYHRIDLQHPGSASHVRLLRESRRYLRKSAMPTRLILAHRALLPVASVLGRERVVTGISVLCHGSDVWCARPRLRRSIENHLMGGPDVRVVAVSSFTAGALSGTSSAVVLPPALSEDWFQMLVAASAANTTRSPGIGLVTAFRLEDWRAKGFPELLAAVAALENPDLHLTVCGSGNPSEEMLNLIDVYPRCTIRAGLSDRELALQLAAADLFVLATRTKHGRCASGEGFGLVLLEAQVAGTPVVGPAYGGSHDAYLDGVTGITPNSESVEALESSLRELLCNRVLLAQMGKRAAEWARECFAPECYASRAVSRLL